MDLPPRAREPAACPRRCCDACQARRSPTRISGADLVRNLDLLVLVVALPLFLFWYLRIFGGHGWTLTLSLTILTPVATFLFFEAVLKILLPKGITEPLFLPLYAFFF